jgi:hypothetical protein
MPVPLSPEARWDLEWWSNLANLTQGVSFQVKEPSLTVITDASKEGWGGHLGEMVVWGKWSREESLNHINWLELKAVWLTLQEFQATISDSLIEVLLDNTTAVAYINNQGGTRSRALCALALQVWKWCRDHNVSVVATHISGVKNILADALSRGSHYHPTEWSLDKRVAEVLFKTWETPLVDMFASEKNHLLPVFYSVLPSPKTSAINAMTQDWSMLRGYAYPPINMIDRVLGRLLLFPTAHILLVAPFWPTQVWFKTLKDLLVGWPRMIPTFPGVITNSETGMFYPDPERLRLAVWPLSANPCVKRDFQKKLLRFRPRQDDLQHAGFTIPVSHSMGSGVGNERWIPIRPLSRTYVIS